MKLAIVCGDEEWVGVYVAGKLQFEDHSLNAMRVVELFARNAASGEGLTWLEHIVVSCQDWLYDVGRLPPDLDDLPEQHVLSRGRWDFEAGDWVADE